MIRAILFIIAFVWTGLATWHDLKKKKIPDSIHIAAAFGGLMISSAISFQAFLYSLLYGGFFLLVGFLVSVTGGWGGADGKFLGALGTYFHFSPVLFLLSLLVSTFGFKGYLVATGRDPGKIPREEWLEKGVPFLPAFLAAEVLMAFILLI